MAALNASDRYLGLVSIAAFTFAKKRYVFLAAQPVLANCLSRTVLIHSGECSPRAVVCKSGWMEQLSVDSVTKNGDRLCHWNLNGLWYLWFIWYFSLGLYWNKLPLCSTAAYSLKLSFQNFSNSQHEIQWSHRLQVSLQGYVRVDQWKVYLGNSSWTWELSNFPVQFVHGFYTTSRECTVQYIFTC
jgi:hypothetical protein